METRENDEGAVDQALHTGESNEQKQDIDAAGNVTVQQYANRKVKLAKAQKVGAVRMAGFLFWINFAGVLLLLVGFVAPGWITVRANQKMHRSSTYYGSDKSLHLYGVYQDYGLWYVTQCYNHDGENNVCETMTYRTIDDVYGDDDSYYARFEIGAMEVVGEDKFMFHGAGLVFKYTQFVRAQTLYTVGVLTALFTIYQWYLFRSNVATNKSLNLSKKKWALMFILTVVSFIFVMVPVIMFASIRGDLKDESSDGTKIESAFGSVFAGFGGGVMALIAITIFLQVICCRNTDTYICSCYDVSEELGPAGKQSI